MAEGSTTTSGRPPLKEIRVGGIAAAIWERSTEQNGMVSKQYSVRINKRYRDNKTSEFKTTEYYFPADLPKLMLAAQKAFEFVSLKGEE